ncbi:DUF1631 family protein [Melaminivora sp.]
MTLPASSARTVFRACVVNAIRGGEGLMQELVDAAKNALAGLESSAVNLQQRQLAADAARLLGVHAAQLIKAYPMALLEAFADGPAAVRTPATPQLRQDSGIDFGELSLVDDADVLAQVELARAQQAAMHTTEAALAELTALVSSAQGLPSVQPERNPLRPENYIRALQQVVADLGVAGEVRQLWMAQMRELLGRLLVGVYQQTTQELRAQGVVPVGYAVAGAMGNAARLAIPVAGVGSQVSARAMLEVPAHSHAGALASHYGGGYGAAGSAWGGMYPGVGLNAQAEEALLTVGLLQQMLAGQVAATPWAGSMQATISTTPADAAYRHAVGQGLHNPATEALQDLEQLELLVGRLSGEVPMTDWGTGAHGPVAPHPANVQDAATGVVSRMMEHMAQDARLLPPVQRAVQNLAPALRQLVQYDTGFFSDEQHPARRLLDELTQRSLAFEREDGTEFQRFMRLVDEAVAYLCASRITSARPFERVLQALNKAWEQQEQRQRERQEARQRLSQQRERRALLAERLAAGFRRLEGAQRATPEMLNFVTGPWALAVAHAQIAIDGPQEQADGAVLQALAPLLLACGQQRGMPKEAPAWVSAIDEAMPLIEQALQRIDHPASAIAQLGERLLGWRADVQHHPEPASEVVQAAPSEWSELTEPSGVPEVPAASTHPSTAAPAPLPAAQPQHAREPASSDTRPEVLPGDSSSSPMQALVSATELRLQLNDWLEITTQQGSVRRQLTWISPNKSLFLFTGMDGSSQSMTRRMIDKLAAEGLLRAVA